VMFVGMVTSLIQKFLMYRLKENCHVKMDEVVLEAAIVFVSFFLILRLESEQQNNVLFDTCSSLIELNSEDEYLYKRHMSLIFEESGIQSYACMCGFLAFFLTAYAIILLRRTLQFQYILVMIQRMIVELGFFFSSFGALIFVFFIVLRLANADL